MTTDWMGFATLLAFLFLIAAGVSYSRLPPTIKLLVYAGLFLRLVGAIVRHEILFDFYGGGGDAVRYYQVGLDYASLFRQLDMSPFLYSSVWHGDVWRGTQFVNFLSGFILSFLGPTMLGEFLAFSLLAFVGLVGFAVAFRRAYPHVWLSRYVRWIWLFPSLWFWTSSVGKEAVAIMGLGLAVAGFIGRDRRVHWPLLVVGLFFVFAVRPELAIVVLLSLVLAQWLSFAGRWTLGRTVSAVLLAVVGLTGIWYSMQSIGIGEFDVEGIESQLEADPARRASGGNEPVSLGWRGIPGAALNVLFRPFPWEANNLMVLFSSAEIILLWFIVLLRRRNLARTLRHWRSDPFARLAVVFMVIYTIALGMMVVNVGIIARQRIFLFPFVFLLLEAVPVAAVGRRPSTLFSRGRSRTAPHLARGVGR